jgi:hypothetical protein
MITVTLVFNKVVSEFNFQSLTDALVFARSTDIGTRFQIREGKTLLAKGTIEDYKEGRYE